jgi:hypothetical protein
MNDVEIAIDVVVMTSDGHRRSVLSILDNYRTLVNGDVLDVNVDLEQIILE